MLTMWANIIIQVEIYVAANAATRKDFTKSKAGSTFLQTIPTDHMSHKNNSHDYFKIRFNGTRIEKYAIYVNCICNSYFPTSSYILFVFRGPSIDHPIDRIICLPTHPVPFHLIHHEQVQTHQTRKS
jgi:hypothetical protein